MKDERDTRVAPPAMRCPESADSPFRGRGLRPALACVAAMSVFVPSGLVGQARQLVDVGGHRLEAVVAGSGSPVVVFETGAGDGLEAWDPVFAAAADYTTAVAYSRAGLGDSEPGPVPESYERTNAELRTLLTNLGLAPPFVLVGHSQGGELARAYHYTYPAEVAALVLVDGSHERQYLEFQAVDSTFDPWAEPEDSTAWRSALLRVRRAGRLPNSRPLDDLPVYVLTHLNASPSDADPPFFTEEIYRVWLDLHSEIFSTARQGAHVVTQRSGHYIQRDEPELVLWAIRRAVDDVRSTKSCNVAGCSR